MALVNIMNVTVQNNPSPFLTPFQFEITFECIEDLPEDLEWKIIYVGSAESMDCDQTLETILVGPVPGGTHMFVFEAGPPDVRRIPDADALGVTVVLLTCSYRNQEFIRVGYFVNNEYDDPELRENPPSSPQFDKIQRNILADKPRVTRFTIQWTDDKYAQTRFGCHQEQMEDDEQNLENMMPSQNTESLSNQFDSNPTCQEKRRRIGDYPEYRDESIDNLDKIFAGVPGLN